MDSPFANVRAGAVEELAHLLAGSDAGLAAAARVALEEMADDDSRRVSDAAARALSGKAAAPAPCARAGGAARRGRARAAADSLRRHGRVASRSSSMTSRVAIALARAAHWKDAVALGGAALLVLGYFRTASWDTAWDFATRLDEIWFFWSPLEAFGAALLVAVAVLESRRGGLARESADGVLLGVGLIAAAAMVAFVGSTFEFDGTARSRRSGRSRSPPPVCSACSRGAPRKSDLRRRTGRIAAAGVALGLLPLVVNLAEWSDSGLLEDWGGSYLHRGARRRGARRRSLCSC